MSLFSRLVTRRRAIGSPVSRSFLSHRYRFPALVFPALVATAVLLALVVASPARGADLFTYVPGAGPPVATATASLAPGELDRHVVRVDPTALAAAPETLWLEVAPGVHRLAFRSDHETTTDGGHVWRGRLAEDDPSFSTITLSQHGDLLHGSFAVGGLGFALRPVPGNVHHLVAEPRYRSFECATGTAGDEHAGEEALPALRAPAATDAAAVQAAVSADDLAILLVYPEAQVEEWGGNAYAIAHAHHSIDSLNTTFHNSRIPQRAYLAGVRQWTSPLDNLTFIRRQARGSVALAAARDNLGADLVAVYSQKETTGGCGMAYLMVKETFGPQMAPDAYSVSSLRCDSYNHGILVHEIGHNLGAQHFFGETSGSREEAVFPYAFGWHGTIMGSGGLVLFYSNPSVTYRGRRMGREGEADNARALRQTLPVAAAWRSGGSEQPRNNLPPPVPPRPSVTPAAPTELAATVLSATAVELSWKDNTSSDIGFNIEGKKDGEDWTVLAEAPRHQSPHDRVVQVVDGLEPGTTYRFRVQALGEEADSQYSNVVRATTRPGPPAAPAGLAAEPGTEGTVVLTWERVERADGYEVELRTAVPAADRGASALAWEADGATVDGLEPATPYSLRLRAVNEAGASPWSDEVSVTTAGAVGPCAEDGSALCLLDGRFEVRGVWRNPHPPFGHGTAAARSMSGSQRAGFFTFFNPANVELGVKVLDGRPVNGAFWFFYGALSDVEYWLTVRDTADGGSRTYHNPAFELCGLGDTQAFPQEPEEPAAQGARGWAPRPAASAAAPRTEANAEATGACVPGEDALCLAGGRFRVEVEWQDPRRPETSGAGRVMQGLGTDLTGHFWFFREDNLELSVKILDGRAVNGHHWIFWGGLSDVGYTLKVTDTEEGEEHTFVNPAFSLCGGSADDVL